MKDCVVKENCQRSYDCDFCDDYNLYLPVDVRIKSPKQIQIKAAKKALKKEKKQSSRSKIGKSARLAGKRAERELEKLLTSWGLEVKRVALSGALKANSLIGGRDMYAGDLKLTISDKMYDIESKRHSNLGSYYNKDLCYIEDFCYIVSADYMWQHLAGCDLPFATIEDKKMKKLHDFFEQDNSHIVAMKMNYKPWLFAIREDIFNELKGVI